jgi:carbonic anhydrase
MLKNKNNYSISTLKSDVFAAIIVFLIAIPLCLGIALASGTPLYSGLIAGIVGGIVVGILSPSRISVSGPSAGIATVILAAMLHFQNFNTILLITCLSGLLQIFASIRRFGFFADYIPSSVVKGMLSAVGILLICKQLPFAFSLAKTFGELKFHLLEVNEGYYIDPITNLSFHINSGAFVLSLLSLISLILMRRLATLPSAIIVVVFGSLINEFLIYKHAILAQHGPHLVNIPNNYSIHEFFKNLPSPNWQAINNPMVYFYALVLACVTSLESLLNITASEKLDPHHQNIDKNRELMAQGIGNFVSGLIGGLPVTAVVIRTTVNIQNQAQTKIATIVHGSLIFASFFFLADVINRIPLCILASILIFTGYKLANPKMYWNIYHQGSIRFIPFIVTVIAVVMFNLLFGVILGLILNLFFILKYNSQARIDLLHESYPSGDVNRLVLPQQTSFLNKASIVAELNAIPNNSQLIIDARFAEFIDKEIIEYIQEFCQEQAPTRKISLNLIGFKDCYEIHDHLDFIKITTYDAQSQLTPFDVLQILKQGNERFLKDQSIHRSNIMDIQQSAQTQHPIAIILGCIDSRVPVETIFDMTLGDIFCVRIAGNVINDDILASIEYGCHIIGTKLIVVLGHSQCGAIQSACQGVKEGHITQLLDKIKPAIEAETQTIAKRHGNNIEFITEVTNLNIAHSLLEIFKRSKIIQSDVIEQKIGIIGAHYNVSSGKVEFSDYGWELEQFKDKTSNILIDAIHKWYQK